MGGFRLESPYRPSADQARAASLICDGLEAGLATQVLLGVTGAGKTFTMANVIARMNRPALVISHNKILAAQLCNEFKEFFPHNRVEYFVSYYDYYRPEAYIPSTDTYVEKDMSSNDEIDKLRHSATSALCERRDVIVVASVSCIYGLGEPKEYFKNMLSLRPGMALDRDFLVERLVKLQYKRNDYEFERSTFRARGDVVDVFPSNASAYGIRIELFGDSVENLHEIDARTGLAINRLNHAAIFPATHYVLGDESVDGIIAEIRSDLAVESRAFRAQNRLLEAQRLEERVSYDAEMLRELGYCSGVENYSRYFDRRRPGEPPYTLLDYFPDDFITFVDESHMTLPQLSAMHSGDRSRKANLVDYGFRLKSAFDNRPLRFDEFRSRIRQCVCVSATPGERELGEADQVVEQLLRPTGLVDPPVTVIPTRGQIDDLLARIRKATAKNGRTLIAALTKRMAENLTSFLLERGVKAAYMHHEIQSLERITIINDLRRGAIDALVGINLLREGLDLPEVVLVAILDADKEGFLRSRTAIIQTVGRAARNADAEVVLYADVMTDSMRAALDETDRRRAFQLDYNRRNGITPKTVKREIKNSVLVTEKAAPAKGAMTEREARGEIERLKGLMRAASAVLDFESCIILRDRIAELADLLKTR